MDSHDTPRNNSEPTRKSVLSPDQKAQFEKDGFLVLPPISSQISENIVQWSNEVKNLPHDSSTWMHYEEVTSTGQRILCRTENFADYHSGFKELFRGPGVLSVLEDLSGEEMVLFKEKINYKSPNAGGFKAHLDAPAYTHVSNVKHLSVLIAVEPATKENGCLEVVAGSHKMNIPIGADVCIEPEWCEKQTWTPVPLATGEMLIFGSYLAHRSGANHSDEGRAAIYATYNALSDGGDKRQEYYTNRRKLWPPTADRVSGQRYEEGARLYGYASPMLTVVENGYADVGL
ncbi:PhyH-domain-containing protein [Dendrothele bispora CBS 962.96]|uniref:PhyH-domain-containing protein n=1 Tax=Dendrothele bispora (strain CBS 962.96) TaxID=1314807 RepID=A0A4S8LQT7_DENBC|nr:PhyH-domain-containing protein [Dendrothele bispora CBS 962.96]